MEDHVEDDRNKPDHDSNLELHQDPSDQFQDQSSLHNLDDYSVEEPDEPDCYFPMVTQSESTSGELLADVKFTSNEDSRSDGSLTSVETDVPSLGFPNLAANQDSYDCHDEVTCHDINKLLDWDATLAKSVLEQYKSTVKSFGSFFSEGEKSERRLSGIPSVAYNRVFFSSGLADVSSTGAASSSTHQPLFFPTCDVEDPFPATSSHSFSSTPLRQAKQTPLTSTLKVPLSTSTSATYNLNFSLKDYPEVTSVVKLVMESTNEYQKLLDETIAYCGRAQKNMLQIKDSQKLKDESAALDTALKVKMVEQEHLKQMQGLRKQHQQQTNELRDQVTRLEKTVAEKSLKSKELFVLNGDLCKDFEVIKAKLKNSEENSSVLGQKINVLNADFIDMYAENASLKSQLRQLDDECNCLMARNKEYKTQAPKLLVQIDQLRKERDELLAKVDRAEQEHSIEEVQQENLTEMKCELERLLQQRHDDKTATENELSEAAMKNKLEVDRLSVMVETEKLKHREAQAEVDALTDDLERVKEVLNGARAEAVKYKESFNNVQEDLAEETKARKEEKSKLTALKENSTGLKSLLVEANKSLQNTRCQLENHKESLTKLEITHAAELISKAEVQKELHYIRDCLKQILIDAVAVIEGTGISIPVSENYMDMATNVLEMLEKMRCEMLSNRNYLEKANGEITFLSAELKDTKVELDKSETTVRELEENRSLQKEALKAIEENVAMTLETLVTLRQDRHQELTTLNEVAKMIAVDCTGSTASVKESSKLSKLFGRLLYKQTIVRKNFAQLERILRSLSDNSVPKFDESICGRSFSQSGASILEEQDSIIEELPITLSPVGGVKKSPVSKGTPQPDDRLFKVLRKVFKVKRTVQKKSSEQTRTIANFREKISKLQIEKVELERAISEGRSRATLLQELLNEKEAQLALARQRFEKLTFKICDWLAELDIYSTIENKEMAMKTGQITLSLKTIQAKFQDSLQLDDQAKVRLDNLLQCFFVAIASYTADQKELSDLKDELACIRLTLEELRVKHSCLEQTRSTVGYNDGILHDVIKELGRELQSCRSVVDCIYNPGSLLVPKKLEGEILPCVETCISQMQHSLGIVKSKVGESAVAVVSLEGKRLDIMRAATGYREESVRAKAESRRLEDVLNSIQCEHEHFIQEHKKQVESFSKLLEERQMKVTELEDCFEHAQDQWIQKKHQLAKTIKLLQDELAQLQANSSEEKDALCAELKEQSLQREQLSKLWEEQQEEMEKQISILKDDNCRKTQETKQWEELIEFKGDQIRKIMDELKNKTALIEEMKEEKRLKCEEMLFMREDIERKECDVKLKNTCISQNDFKIKAFKADSCKELKELNVKCNLLNEENVKLEAIVTEMRTNYMALELKQEEMNSVHEKQKLEMVELNSLLKEQLKFKNENFEHLTEELKSKENALYLQQNTVNKLRPIIKEQEDKLVVATDELGSLRADILTLRLSQDRTLEEKEDLLNLIEEGREKLRVADAAVEEWKELAQVQERRSEGVEALNNTVRDLEERNMALTNSLDKKQQKLGEVEKHHAVYKRTTAALKERFRQTQSELDDSVREAANCRQRVDRLSAEVDRLQRVAQQCRANEAQQRWQSEKSLAQIQLLRHKCEQLQKQLAELQSERSVTAAAAPPTVDESSQGSSDIVPDSQPNEKSVPARPAATVYRQEEPTQKAGPGQSRGSTLGSAGTNVRLALHSKINVRTCTKVNVRLTERSSLHGSLNDIFTVNSTNETAMDGDCNRSSSAKDIPERNACSGSQRPVVQFSQQSRALAGPCQPTALCDCQQLAGEPSAGRKRSLITGHGKMKKARTSTQVSAQHALSADTHRLASHQAKVSTACPDGSSSLQPKLDPLHRSTRPSHTLTRVALSEALHGTASSEARHGIPAARQRLAAADNTGQ